jgi:hypothetical protein
MNLLLGINPRALSAAAIKLNGKDIAILTHSVPDPLIILYHIILLPLVVAINVSISLIRTAAKSWVVHNRSQLLIPLAYSVVHLHLVKPVHQNQVLPYQRQWALYH